MKNRAFVPILTGSPKTYAKKSWFWGFSSAFEIEYFFEVSGKNTNITKIKYNDYQLTQDDVVEAATVGGTAGDIIMWLKCDEIVETPKLFTLLASGYEKTEFMVDIVAPAGE